jgi:excisionase family DNA binding protein
METQRNDKKLLSVRAASKELGISMPTMRRLIRTGAIPVHQLGGMVRVNVEEVMTATLRAEAAN